MSVLLTYELINFMKNVVFWLLECYLYSYFILYFFSDCNHMKIGFQLSNDVWSKLQKILVFSTADQWALNIEDEVFDL